MPNEIIIDEEFKNLIPPLTKDEYEQLEKNIITEGCRESIITWGKTVIDGHNRHEICSKHNISFKTVEKEFKDRNAVIEWMILNQFGRRSLSNYDRSLLALRLEDVFKEKAKANMSTGKVRMKKDGCQNADNHPPMMPKDKIDTKKKIADIANVSHDTIHKVKYIQEKGDDEMKSLIRSGDMTVRAAYQAIRREENIRAGVSFSDSLSRRIAIYPSMNHFKMHIANSFEQIMGKGKLAEGIIRTHYDAMPEVKQKKLIEVFNHMTPEQIERTADLNRRD